MMNEGILPISCQKLVAMATSLKGLQSDIPSDMPTNPENLVKIDPLDSRIQG